MLRVRQCWGHSVLQTPALVPFFFSESTDANAKLDMEGLAVIGNNLMVHCAKNYHWQTGYQILCHMIHFNIEYMKYCGMYPQISLIAMETCLQFFQPEMALQILKGRMVSNLRS